MDSVRLLAAGLSCFIVLLFAARAAFKLLPNDASPALTGLALGAVLVGTAMFSLVVFNLGRRKIAPGPTLQDLEAQGKVIPTDYRATRAFEVEEFEDEGRHLFVELADGSVLFLSGQYLYDVGLSDEDLENGVSPRFPTTEFTMRRHKEKGFVLDITTRGEQLNPEFVAKPFGPEVWKRDGVPEDGAIIRDKTYDALKAEHRARA